MITVTFVCGHTKAASGAETELRCGCGESQVVCVDAPAPHFVGHVRGPHAEYKDLPAEAVSFKKDDDA